MTESHSVWYSQLFDCDGAGVMLALPAEAIGDWSGSDGDVYDDVIDRCVLFHMQRIGPTNGLFVGDFDGEGVHESHWMRWGEPPSLYLVAWSSWTDPKRKLLPEDKSRVARAWRRGQDPRQAWLNTLLIRGDLPWRRSKQLQTIDSGVLMLLHAESPALAATLAQPHAVAQCGQVVPAGLLPGRYYLDTFEYNDLPEGDHLCAVCRWVPSAAGREPLLDG
jgi:hypothetical protein